MYTSGLCFFQSLTKLWVRIIVWRKGFYIFHLDYKENRRFVSIHYSVHKAMDMLDASFGWCIGKANMTVFFFRNFLTIVLKGV